MQTCCTTRKRKHIIMLDKVGIVVVNIFKLYRISIFSVSKTVNRVK